MPSKIESEMMKATKLRQAEGEPRSKYFVRLLNAGQSLSKAAWDALSGEAQRWYNAGVIAYGVHDDAADIPEFSDAAPPATERVVLKTRPTEPEPEQEPEQEEPDQEFEEDQPPLAEEDAEGEPEPEPEPEPATRRAASKPAPKPAGPKPTAPKPKPASTKTKAAAPRTNGSSKASPSKPPKPAAQGASTMIKRMLLKDINTTNAELTEKLREAGISVTPISVSTIRSDFKHTIRVLQEAGYAKELPKLGA